MRHQAGIKVAEAEIIENTQRDINIALINELAIISKLLEIDTLDVIRLLLLSGILYLLSQVW